MLRMIRQHLQMPAMNFVLPRAAASLHESRLANASLRGFHSLSVAAARGWPRPHGPYVVQVGGVRLYAKSTGQAYHMRGASVNHDPRMISKDPPPWAFLGFGPGAQHRARTAPGKLKLAPHCPLGNVGAGGGAEQLWPRHPSALPEESVSEMPRVRRWSLGVGTHSTGFHPLQKLSFQVDMFAPGRSLPSQRATL